MNDLVTGYSAGLIVVIGGLTTLACAHLIARITIATGLLPDRPNARSSHAHVTPRSGGLAIVGGWAAGMLLTAGFAGASLMISPALAFASLVAASFLLGLADDRYNLRAAYKFLGQVAVAVLFVAIFGGLKAAPLPLLGMIELGVWGAPLAVFWIVAFMNAFNFMDGVNGIAAACGAFALAALAVASAFGGALFWSLATGLGAAALLAFLPINTPKGRLFMGDNGSQAVGFLIAASAVGAANASDEAVGALFAPVVMLPFLFDVAFTLVHRAARGENILDAHREHLYQLCARSGLSHISVTAIFLSLTALSTAVAFLMLRMSPGAQWLAPLALAALFLFPATAIFNRARRARLLEAPEATPLAAEPIGRLEFERPRRHAAE